MKPLLVRAIPLAALALLCAGCATVGSPAATGAAADPFEPWNRKVYAFNDVVDKALLKPVATAYRDVVPQLLRTGVDNFFGNIGDVWSTVNHLLQGKGQSGFEMGVRVVPNTTIGLAGLLDPASEMKGLERKSEDFGQTLGRWGFANGPFLVLPLLGPSTVRDTVGFLAARTVSASTLPQTDAGQYTVTALELISTRAGLLATGQLIDEVALDRYVFTRDGYLARRNDQLYDGAPPLEDLDPGADAPAAAATAASAPKK